MSKPRVAILGGGVGGVVAAFALSAPGWESHLDSITLYQQGWRLGGKGASGRGKDMRIEEHGLHVWFGFYANAFRVLRECHDELDQRAHAPVDPQPRWTLACASIEESFRACGPVTVTDHDECGWLPWVANFPRFDADPPWSPRPPENARAHTAGAYAAHCMHFAAAAVNTGAAVEERFFGEIGEILAGAADALDAATAGLRVVEHVLPALDHATQILRERAEEWIQTSTVARRAWYVVDLMLAIARGLVKDGVIANNDFDVINDVEFSAWLRNHGAARDTVDSVLVRAVIYDLPFAYRGGDPRRRAIEAGTALRGFLRIFFAYRGAIIWKMNAGMGDVVFAPLYELLHKRGVTFKFFHRVEALRAKAGMVEEIDIDVQADVPPKTKARDYLMPSTINGSLVWPAQPTVIGPQPIPPAAYESWLMDPAITRVARKTLRRRDGDFDHVVYAMPITTVPHIAPELIKQSTRWRRAVNAIESVPTQALQLWLNKTTAQLSPHADGAIVGGFVEPFDTWADMIHLVKQEAVGSATIAYFCNVLADAPLPARGAAATAWLDGQHTLVRLHAQRFLRQDIRHLWPRTINPVTGEFDWNLLVAPPGVSGAARLMAQLWRANVEPSERYILSVPGSSVHRIEAGDTDFRNLYVAGDWTACVLNVGCVEAAAISGMHAANAVLSHVGANAALQRIVGHDEP